MFYKISLIFSLLVLSFVDLSKDETSEYSNYCSQAQDYCKKNNLNTSFFILIDLGIHSGKKRFFVYDFKEKKINSSYMVSHGCGDNEWGQDQTKENPKISNAFDSHCSSLGKYIIKGRGASQWGIGVNYTLIGKDKTNYNAQKRAIVLHSWNDIPHEEVFPDGTPEGWGCPAISNRALTELDPKLKDSKKGILLWIVKK